MTQFKASLLQEAIPAQPSPCSPFLGSHDSTTALPPQEVFGEGGAGGAVPLPNGIFLPELRAGQTAVGMALGPSSAQPEVIPMRQTGDRGPEKEQALAPACVCGRPSPSAALPSVGRPGLRGACQGGSCRQGAAGQGMSGDRDCGRCFFAKAANQQCSQVRRGGGQPGRRVPHRDISTKPLAAPGLAPSRPSQA